MEVEDEKLMSDFYEHLAGTDKGMHFLSSPLRPVVFLDFVKCSYTKGLQENIINQLKDLGLEVRGCDDSVPPQAVLDSGVRMLRKLYKEARRRLDTEKLFHQNGKSLVDDRPLILVDEYDRPWRQLQNARFSKLYTQKEEEERLEDIRKYGGLVRSVIEICDVLKALIRDDLYGIALVTLIRLGGTGLSKLDTTTDLGIWEEHHDLFGISEEDLKHILENAPANAPLTWDKTLSWARNLKIVDQNKHTEEEQQQVFLDYLKDEINGFVTGFMDRKEGKEIKSLSPLYSPRDALAVIQNIIEDKRNPPQRHWLLGAKDAFSELIASSGKYDDAVLALVGGPVPMSDILTFQNMSTKLNERSDMRVLFYNLGLLRVDRVTADGRVFLQPVVSLHSKDIVDILVGAYKKIHILEDAEVEEYYQNPRTLVHAVERNLALVGRGIQATHGKIPFDALDEKSVQHRVHDIFLHQFHHGRMRIAREYHIGKKEGYMDFFLAIKEAARKGEAEQMAPLLNAEWRKEPSNKLPPKWKRPRGPIVEIKIVRNKGQASVDAAHREAMLNALRQVWSYRHWKNYDPQQVWLIGIICSWGEDGSLIVKSCGGEFVGRKDKVRDRRKRQPIEILKEVLVDEDLDKKGTTSLEPTWEEITVLRDGRVSK
eukprot:gb/GECG01006075.1/.p1 GENE.gb/GECG01006075.1/~~gb/GECG01006075.1/.p1  ORF type:complete len:654 (+),score=85.67 gb/GECG01006075.1/:1-1962(+)